MSESFVKFMKSFPDKIKKVLSWKILLYLVLFDLAFIFLYPFLYMIVTSLKSMQDINDVSVVWIINQFEVKNYADAVELLEYPIHLFNTFMMTLFAVLGHVLSGAFIGYGFARFNFKGKNFLFFCLVLSMVVPIQTIIIPIYIFFSRLGWLNTLLPLTVPTYFGFGLQGALFIFIFRQFFLSLPKSLEEAASIDGAGVLKTYFKIAFPSASSSILICTVLGMVWHWHDVFEPSIYLTKQDNYLLSMMLPIIENLVNSPKAELANFKLIYSDATIMASATLVVLPLLIAFLFLQKHFVESIEHSGITGE